MGEKQKPNVAYMNVPDPAGDEYIRAIDVVLPDREVGMVVVGLTLIEEEREFPELFESATDTDDEPRRAAS